MDKITYIDLAIYALLAVAAIGFILALMRVNKAKAELASSERLRSELAQGEKRMLDFLHHLGLSIDKENTHAKLYKVIVNGVATVTKSKGAALYLIDPTGTQLQPAQISTRCTQLISDPVAGSSDDRKVATRAKSINIHEGPLGQCLTNNTPYFVESLKAHDSLQNVPYSEDGAAMISPLIHAGHQIGVLAVTKEAAKGAFTIDDLFTFASIAEQSAFAIGNFDAHHQAAEKLRMESELQTAQEVQQVLIPEYAPLIPGFSVYGYNLPAQMISGDYYDYTAVSDDTTGVVIADVSGKGVPAGIMMATFRSSLKTIASGIDSPADSLSHLNQLIFPDIREDMFISAIYAHLKHETGKVVLARAGHNPPYILRRSTSEIEKIKPPGLAVGIDEGASFTNSLQDYELQMNPKDVLILYTDGIIEATNLEGEEYGAERFEQSIKANSSSSAEGYVGAILEDVAAFVDDAAQADDITLVIIEKQ